MVAPMRSNSSYTATVILVCLFGGQFLNHLSTVSADSEELKFIQWGQPCKIPLTGGEHVSLKEECDASKGLYCNGVACECTYSEKYGYDHDAKECRRKLGKPCHFVDLTRTDTHDILDSLPFNLKCHSTSDCVKVPLPKLIGKHGEYEEEKEVNMCVCKEGYIPSINLNGCYVSPPYTEAPDPNIKFLR